MLVLDASVLVGLLIPDEQGIDLAAEALRHEVFAAPALLWAEVRNILIVSERRGRISATVVDQALESIDAPGIRFDGTPSNAAVLHLCRGHGLTAYDALYLDLALCERAELATLHAGLARAARAEGVTVI